MSAKIRIFDTTLRDGIAGTATEGDVEKRTTAARMLEAAGVATIEAGYPAQSPVEPNAVKRAAAALNKAEVAALASCSLNEVESAVEAVRRAVRPVVHLYVSARETEGAYARPDVCRRIRAAVRCARDAGATVQFSIACMEEMERPFRRQCIAVAVDAGATRIGVPDCTGLISPSRYDALVRDVVRFVGPAVTVSAHCHNASGRAVDNALAAVDAGAGQVETSVQGVGQTGGNAALAEVARRLTDRSSVDPEVAKRVAAFLWEAGNAEMPDVRNHAGECGKRQVGPVGWCAVEVAAL